MTEKHAASPDISRTVDIGPERECKAFTVFFLSCVPAVHGFRSENDFERIPFILTQLFFQFLNTIVGEVFVLPIQTLCMLRERFDDQIINSHGGCRFCQVQDRVVIFRQKNQLKSESTGISPLLAQFCRCPEVVKHSGEGALFSSVNFLIGFFVASVAADFDPGGMTQKTLCLVFGHQDSVGCKGDIYACRFGHFRKFADIRMQQRT